MQVVVTTDGTDGSDATVVVWRSTLEGRNYLALHRHEEDGGRHGSARPGVWTVPTATCESDERLDDAATRALWEQTGLVLALTPVEAPDEPPVFAARADADAIAVLDEEHDDHAWLPAPEAMDRCAPEGVVRALRVVEHWLTEG